MDLKNENETTQISDYFFSFINSDKKDYFHIISSFAVQQNTYFFEIEILDVNEIQLGWVSRFSEFNDENGIVNNEQSVFLKFYVFSPGDILGCLINVETKNVYFYHNGKLLNMHVNVNFFDYPPFFAFACVPPKQEIVVNFGQITFKYPPLNQLFKTFHSETVKNQQFLKFKEYSNFKWFCQTEFFLFDYSQQDIKQPLFFNDFKQKQFDQIVVKMENMIDNNIDVKKVIDYALFHIEKSKNKYKYFRFFQSIIEIMGQKIKKSKLNLLAYCVVLTCAPMNLHLRNESFISETSIKFLSREVSNFYSKSFHAFNFHYFLSLEKILISDNIKICNFCILISHFYDHYHLFDLQNNNTCCKSIFKLCNSFLRKVLLYSTDNWTKLYSLIALTKLCNICFKYKLECNNKSIRNLIDDWKNIVSSEIMLKNNQNVKEQSVLLQLYLCANEFNHKFENNFYNNIFRYFRFPRNSFRKILMFDKNHFQMNPIDKSDNIKLSPQNLMVRNDDIYIETIRSKFSIISETFLLSCANHLKVQQFYFEVTIHTFGKMIIGFAAKHMDIRNVVGQNALSIGIDGYNQCVIMNKKIYTYKNDLFRWKVGDVIGVYINFNKQIVIFGINEKIIELNGNPFQEEFIFASLPCHAAVSLDMFQQCYFNFNCSIPISFINQLKPCNKFLNIQKFRNSVIVYGKHTKAKLGNIAINASLQQVRCRSCANQTHVVRSCGQCDSQYTFCTNCANKSISLICLAQNCKTQL